MKRKYELKEEIFSNLDSNNAYWLGFLYGDGNCTTENKVRCALSEADYTQLVRFRNFVGSEERPIKRFVNSFGGACCSFEFRSWRIHRDLKKYELTKRKENRGRLHTDLLQDNLSRDFVRGLFDADGSFYYDGLHKNNLFAEITGHMAVLKDIKNILVRFNVISDKKKIVKNGSVFRIRLAKDDTLKFIRFIYANKPRYYLPRKYGMALSYLERLNDKTPDSTGEATVQKYCRPTTEFNVGKYSEFADRKMFIEDKCKCHLEDNE